MLVSLPGFLNAYWPYLAGLALVCLVAGYFSRTLRVNLKRALIVLGLVFAAAAAYELGTGRDIFSLPGDVDRKLSEDPRNPETGHRYYQSYEERFGEEAPEADQLAPSSPGSK